MHRVLVLGAGKIGALISGLLSESGSLRCVPRSMMSGPPAERSCVRTAAPTSPRVALDASDAAALHAHLAAHPVEAVISSLPYYCNAASRRGGARRGHAITSISPRTWK